VATKMGFVDMMVVVVVVMFVDGWTKTVLIFQDLPAFSLVYSIAMLLECQL